MIKKLFSHTYSLAQAESSAYKQSNNKFDFKTTIICVAVAFSLTMIKYFGDVSDLFSFLDWLGKSNWKDKILLSENYQLIRLAYWVCIMIIFYLIVPVLLIKFLFKQNLSDYGLKLQGAFKDYHLYVIMLIIMIPLVLFFSTTSGFQAKYPFYELQTGETLFPNFWIWELLYFFQFFALEFFFRGFMLHGTKHRFGFYSVFVMTIPYCMIHYGKPFSETMAAIIAGIVLGVLSLKSRSILLGVAIHYSVAITMDLAALWQKGFFDK